MKARTAASMAVLIALCCGMAGALGKRSPFKGRIAAYRTADRMQVISSVANKELLLFQRDTASHDLLKIVYVHQGFSDLKGEVLSGERDISISVRRDASCDQTLAAFEKEAPAIPIKGDDTASTTERVVFAPWLSRPTESYRMKCYLLERWEPAKR